MAKTVKTTGKKRKKKSSKVASVKSKKAFKTYQQALDYLFERTDYEKQERLRYNVTTFNLNRMQKLLTLLGNPHKKSIRSISVVQKVKALLPLCWRECLRQTDIKWDYIHLHM
jgi:hypothetical protein